jgi:hypothetical protein
MKKEFLMKYRVIITRLDSEDVTDAIDMEIDGGELQVLRTNQIKAFSQDCKEINFRFTGNDLEVS